MRLEFAKIKGAKIIMHAKSPTFRAAKLKGFTVLVFYHNPCHKQSENRTTCKVSATLSNLYRPHEYKRGPRYPLSAFSPPLSIHFLIFCSLLLFPFSFSHSLYLFSSIVHPIPFYQNQLPLLTQRPTSPQTW